MEDDQQSFILENKFSEYFLKRQDFKTTMKDHIGCLCFFPSL